MRIAAYGSMMCVLGVGLGDLAGSTGLIQFGALGLLGWIVWYLLVRAFPAHVKAQAEERKAFLEYQKKAQATFLAGQADARRDFQDSLGRLTHSLDLMATAISARQRD